MKSGNIRDTDMGKGSIAKKLRLVYTVYPIVNPIILSRYASENRATMRLCQRLIERESVILGDSE
jgi:hypothetical protein